MAPVFAARIPTVKNWDTRLDFGINLKGKPLFGKNKTWRGLLSGIIAATLTVAAQQALLRAIDKDIVVGDQSFSEYPTIVLGILLGAGALIGDAVESFFKRQINIAPGKSWFPFDQIDYILGAIIFTYPIIKLSLLQYGLMVVVGFALHLVTAYAGYRLKLKSSPI